MSIVDKILLLFTVPIALHSREGTRLQNHGHAIPNSCHSARLGELHVWDHLHEHLCFCSRQNRCSSSIFDLYIHGSIGAFLCQARRKRRIRRREQHVGIGASKATRRKSVLACFWFIFEYCYDDAYIEAYSKRVDEGKWMYWAQSLYQSFSSTQPCLRSIIDFGATEKGKARLHGRRGNCNERGCRRIWCRVRSDNQKKRRQAGSG